MQWRVSKFYIFTSVWWLRVRFFVGLHKNALLLLLLLFIFLYFFILQALNIPCIETFLFFVYFCCPVYKQALYNIIILPVIANDMFCKYTAFGHTLTWTSVQFYPNF